LEDERQSVASRINKKIARKIQVYNSKLRKVQKAEYKVLARFESVQKQRVRK
jgi:hypothetical protein